MAHSILIESLMILRRPYCKYTRRMIYRRFRWNSLLRQNNKSSDKNTESQNIYYYCADKEKIPLGFGLCNLFYTKELKGYRCICHIVVKGFFIFITYQAHFKYVILNMIIQLQNDYMPHLTSRKSNLLKWVLSIIMCQSHMTVETGPSCYSRMDVAMWWFRL